MWGNFRLYMNPVDRLWYIICYAPDNEEDKYDYAETVIEDLFEDLLAEGRNVDRVEIDADIKTKKAMLVGWKAAFDFIEDRIKGFGEQYD